MPENRKYQQNNQSGTNFQNNIKDSQVNQAEVIHNDYAATDTLREIKGSLINQADTINNNFLDPETFEDLNIRKMFLERLHLEISERLENSLHEWIKVEIQVEEQMHQVKSQLHKYELVKKDSILDKDAETSHQGLSKELRLLNDAGGISQKIDTTQKLLSLFDREDINGKLLILGEPGAGKTTELVTLANDLLTRAAENESAPVPVIFELTTWQEDKPIKDWIIDQLDVIYSLKKKRSLKWIEQDKIIPLLDGLDELGLEKQVMCIKAINHYMSRQVLGHIVVCCRSEEYTTGEEKLESLSGAIYLKTLTEGQIKDYLNSLGRASLWDKFSSIPEVINLSKIPLFLNFLIFSYQGEAIKSHEELLDIFVDKQLEDPNNKGTYSPKEQISSSQTTEFLNFLAYQLERLGKTEFLIEDINVDWLAYRNEKIKFRVILPVIFGLFSMLTFSLGELTRIIFINSFFEDKITINISDFILTDVFNLIIYGITATIGFRKKYFISHKKAFIKLFPLLLIIHWLPFLVSLIIWPDNYASNFISTIISYLLISLFSSGFFSFAISYYLYFTFRPNEKVRLSFKKMFRWSVAPSFIVAIFIYFYSYWEYGYSVNTWLFLIEALSHFLLVFLVAFLFLLSINFIYFADRVEIMRTTYPNQIVRLSLRNSLIITAINFLIALFLVVIGILMIILGVSQDSEYAAKLWSSYFIYAVFWGIPTVMCSCGFGFVFRHFMLRFVLYKSGKIPWDYERFLRHASKHRFIQKVGGRYRFSHNLLRKHFSQAVISKS